MCAYIRLTYQQYKLEDLSEDMIFKLWGEIKFLIKNPLPFKQYSVLVENAG